MRYYSQNGGVVDNLVRNWEEKQPGLSTQAAPPHQTLCRILDQIIEISPSLQIVIYNLYKQKWKSVRALQAPTSRRRPLGRLDFVFHALQALKPHDPCNAGPAYIQKVNKFADSFSLKNIGTNVTIKSWTLCQRAFFENILCLNVLIWNLNNDWALLVFSFSDNRPAENSKSPADSRIPLFGCLPH